MPSRPIAGAKGAGIAALVRTGILGRMDDAALSTMFKQERAVPDYLLPGFRWT